MLVTPPRSIQPAPGGSSEPGINNAISMPTWATYREVAMTDNVVNLAAYKRKQDDALEDHLDNMEEFEADLHIKMHQSMEAHLASVADIYNIHPALVAEMCMGGLMAILGHAIEEHDSDAAKDVLNYCAEISEQFLESTGCRMGRDQEERLDWRDMTYRHRWEEPPANDGGDS